MADNDGEQPRIPGVEIKDLIAAVARAQEITNNPATKAAVESATRIIMNTNAALIRDFVQPRFFAKKWYTDVLSASTAASYKRFHEMMTGNLTALSWHQDLLDSIQSTYATDALRTTLEGYRALQTPALTGILDSLKLQQDWSHLAGIVAPSIPAFSAAVTQSLVSADYRAAFQGSFADVFLERLNEVDTAKDDEQIEQVANLLTWLYKEFLPKFIQHPASTALRYAVEILVLMVLQQAFAEYRAAPRDAEIDRRLDEIVAMIRAANEKVDDSRHQYIVKAPVLVHTDPNSRSRVILVLTKGVQLEQVEREGQWLYAEYFDFVDGELKRGWVYKRNLQHVEPWDGE